MTDNIQRKKINELKHDTANANKGTERGLRALDDSLASVGLGRSIVTDKYGNIIAGNKTTERAIDRGFEDAIVVHTDGKQLVVVQRDDLDLSDTDPNNPARKLAYYDNRVGQLDLEWDAEQVLADMQAGFEFDGLFNQDELEEIVRGLSDDEPLEDAGAQADKADELLKVWNVERGQVWQIGKHRVMCGDSTSADDVAMLMGGKVADLVITDPPYGVSYADKNKWLNSISKGNRIQSPIENDHESKEDTQRLWKLAFEQMSNIMKRGAVVYCFMPQGGDQMMMMMMMMMMGAGIEPRHELIWLKNNHVLGRVDYAYKHEPILYAWKESGHKFYGDFQTSVIECDKPSSSKLHPTMKPVELIEILINNSSQKREVIYDLFTGSGTTIVACEQTGRVGYGMEIEPKYVAVTLQRLADMGLVPELKSTDKTV